MYAAEGTTVKSEEKWIEHVGGTDGEFCIWAQLGLCFKKVT